MKSEGLLKYVLDNTRMLEELAKLQDDVVEAKGKYADTDLVTFVSDGISIHNPFRSVCGRFDVNPVVEYGADFLMSNWMNIIIVTQKIAELKLKLAK